MTEYVVIYMNVIISNIILLLLFFSTTVIEHKNLPGSGLSHLCGVIFPKEVSIPS